MVILGGRSIGDIVELLGGGGATGWTLTYRYQRARSGSRTRIGMASDYLG